MVPSPTPIPFVAYYLQRYVRAEDTVVDLGCGPDRYRASVAPARYLGIDLTTRSYLSGRPRQVEIVASAQQLPLVNSTIDVVFSVSAFYLFPDAGEVLAEVHRVLKPNGLVLLVDYNRRTQRRLGRIENRTYPAWTQWQLRSRLARAGFIDCRILTPRVTRPVGMIEHQARILVEEAFGTWAVICGRKA